MAALGEEFRAAREARGLTLSDVAEHIHIRSVYLGAIEDEEWSSIGAPVYVRGFIRTYARFLGLDAEDAVARFSDRIGSSDTLPPSSAAAAAASSPAPTATSTRSSARSGPSVLAIAAAVVAVVLVAFVGYEYYQYQLANGGATVAAASPAPQSTAQPDAGPSGSVPGAVPSAAASEGPSPLPSAAKNSIAIRLTERSWLRVVVDGSVQMEGLFPSGTVRSFTGKNALVRAGNAGGVDLTVGGKNVGTMGASGDVVERTFSLQ